MNLSKALLRKFSATRHSANVTLFANSRYYGNYRICSKKIGIWFKEQSILVTKACAKQLEFIAAQRVRRSYQLFQLYTKIWDDAALREFLRAWRRRVRRGAKDFLLASVGVTTFNWERERITEEELYSYADEIEAIHKLKDRTIVCSKCQLRLIIDKEQLEVEYCDCHEKDGPASSGGDEEWEPFVERKDMLIWRREETESAGLYAYKIFGTFADVSADEFLRVQVDVEYRKEWDNSAKRLEIIDSDPIFHSTDNQRIDVIYWEMIWPRLFSNREYIYQRRWVRDEEKDIVLIVSRMTDHPAAPNNPDTCRVTSYWSYMVIKPFTSLDEPGIEFSLTYFEDPGINIPSAVSTWVAMSGLPDFLNKMRQAAKDYKTYIAKKHQQEKLTLSDERDEEIVEEIQVHQEDGVINVSGSGEIQLDSLESEKIELNTKDEIVNEDLSEVEVESSDADGLSEENLQKKNGYLRYFFLTRLFA